MEIIPLFLSQAMLSQKSAVDLSCLERRSERVNDAPPTAARMADILIPCGMVTHRNVFDVEKRVMKRRRKALFEIYW
jgi:hypothetical protein